MTTAQNGKNPVGVRPTGLKAATEHKSIILHHHQGFKNVCGSFSFDSRYQYWEEV